MTTPNAPVAANRRVGMHYRRFAAKPPPAEPTTLPLTCGFTLGSSSPLRGIATRTTGRWKKDCPGPHRPYEGSQRVGDGVGWGPCPCPHRPYEGSQPECRRDRMAGRRSSSPLRGIATAHRGDGTVYLRVLIAPTRDRNPAAKLICRPLYRSSSPLRGIATTGTAARPAPPGSSSPLRGIATSWRLPTFGATFGGPHRPCEGSQRTVRGRTR